VLSQVGRVLFHVDHGAGLHERIIWISFWDIKCNTLILVESLGEIISIDYAEDSSIHIEVDANIQISPCVDSGFLSWDEHLVTLEEHTLRDAAVFNSVLKDVQSIVIEIVVNGALSDTVVLIGILYNGFLEVALEVKNLDT